ncbi:MAG: DUF4105 domain-containing protein [Pseudomonadales bacterium]|nr:DUF4105 domain-containing protein [Pseudomonadales bacterium]MCP5358447.1 DUF4105 domain-containing protein [Pseudomonadales bacterium]
MLVFLALLSGVSLWAQSQDEQGYTLPPITDADAILLPANFNLVDFYLVTVDVGDQVWDNFGHTALRVVDRNSNSDLVFNWGLFDPSGGYVRFAFNFLRGILPYQLGVSPPAWEFGRYEREQRSVWQDKLNLTNAQKETLYKRLAWNLREENIVYDYQYFFDNCTTRVRDYLNEALGGRLQSQNRAPTLRTFRDEVLSHYASVPPVAVSLDVLMNGNIDRRMTQWEQMFLPAQLRRELLSFPSDVMRNGQRSNMLEEPTVIMEFTPPASGPNPYYLLAAGLLLPALLLFLLFKRTSLASFSSQPGVTLRSPGLSYRLMGLLGLVITLCSGLYGLVMSFGWLASAHLDLHHNLNLLLFWPTDLLGVTFALRWLLLGRPCALRAGSHSLVIFYLFAHILAALAYLFLGLTGMGGQNVGSLMLFVLPALLAFAIVAWNTGFHSIRRIRFS